MAELSVRGALRSYKDVEENVHFLPVSYWRDGWAQNTCPRWDGRGVATELGSRVWRYQQLEPRGYWPQTLIDHEHMLDDCEEYLNG